MSITVVRRGCESRCKVKAFAFLLVTVLPFSAASGQFKQDPRDGRTVKISTRLQLLAGAEPASVKAGSPVFVKIKLKNMSSRTVRLSDSAPRTDYEITVADIFGREPPRTEWGMKKLNGDITILRNTELDIEPGR